ncbi:MAG: tyrosine-type recombinase/integrase [Vulcanimicrobiota bacterium]
MRAVEAYVAYLRNEKGLAENSVNAYLPGVRVFVDDCVARDGDFYPDRLDAAAVESTLLDRIPELSASRSRLLVAALRSFLRFLFYKGQVGLDLSVSVPAYRGHNYIIPAFLSPEEMETVLATPDRATSRGLRDFAILLLLARLGLRASEVVHLELDDIGWRDGCIVIRGKGRTLESLPLLSEVGDALAVYLCEGRPKSQSRRVFIRTNAPRSGFRGPAAIGHIVRLALARAAIRPSRRGAAHLFRHGLATKMIRAGATLTEISQVLRHRVETSTEIYTHLAFETLREVARPWPKRTGGHP